MADDGGPWGAAQAGEITFSVTTTFADHLAFQRFFQTLPQFRHARQSAVIVAVVAGVLLAVVICALVEWGLSGASCDLDAVMGPNGRTWLFAKMLGGVLAVEGVVMAVYALQWRRSLAGKVRARLARRPNVAADDPDLKEVLQVRMDEQGYAFATPNWSEGFSWAVATCFRETDERFFIMSDTTRGAILPKRDMHPATIASIRELGQRKLPAEPAIEPPAPPSL